MAYRDLFKIEPHRLRRRAPYRLGCAFPWAHSQGTNPARVRLIDQRPAASSQFHGAPIFTRSPSGQRREFRANADASIRRPRFVLLGRPPIRVPEFALIRSCHQEAFFVASRMRGLVRTATAVRAFRPDPANISRKFQRLMVAPNELTPLDNLLTSDMRSPPTRPIRSCCNRSSSYSRKHESRPPFKSSDWHPEDTNPDRRPPEEKRAGGVDRRWHCRHDLHTEQKIRAFRYASAIARTSPLDSSAKPRKGDWAPNAGIVFSGRFNNAPWPR